MERSSLVLGELPQGYYNLKVMVNSVARSGKVLLCSTCLDARGLTDEELIDGTRRSTLDELALQTTSADKTLVF